MWRPFLVLVVVALMLAGCGESHEPRADDPAVERAKIAQASEDVANLRTLAKLFRLEMGRYPDSLSELTEPTEKERNGFIPELPIDPWGQEYWYEPGDQLVIFSTGPDGEVDTEDDVGGVGD